LEPARGLACDGSDGGWLAFSASGGALFLERYVFHQSSQIDADWKARVEMSQQMGQQWTAGMGQGDAAEVEAARAPDPGIHALAEGHAGWERSVMPAIQFF